MKVVRTERGWAGHFIAADQCRFRRNTLLEYREIKIVVSSVGLMHADEALLKSGIRLSGMEKGFLQIGCDRFYETMAFHSMTDDDRYHDADVHKQILFESKWALYKIDADDEANVMHDAVVDEIMKGLVEGKDL